MVRGSPHSFGEQAITDQFHLRGVCVCVVCVCVCERERERERVNASFRTQLECYLLQEAFLNPCWAGLSAWVAGGPFHNGHAVLLCPMPLQNPYVGVCVPVSALGQRCTCILSFLFS